MHRKGDIHLETLIVVILIMVGFFFVAKGVLFATEQAKYTKAVCKLSVLMREKLPQIDTPVTDIKLFPLECSTIKDDLPLSAYPTTGGTTDRTKQEIVEKQIAVWAADCWDQFGEGYISKNIFGKVWAGNQDKCFICNTFKIKEMPGSVTKQELEHYLATAHYKIIEKNYAGGGGSSGGGGASGSFGESSQTTTTLTADESLKEECEYKGGVCQAGCGANTEVEWQCSAGNKCCVDPSMVISYMDYVQQGDRGQISVAEGLVLEEKKDVYAITFASHTERQALAAYHPLVFVYDLLFNKPERQRIYISRFNDVKDYCNVQD